jgi:hypothetical protein
MKTEDIFQVGKWLIFKPRTCFGKTKQHKGMIVGIDTKSGEIAVAVCATSQVQKRVEFALDRGLPENSLVVIKGGENIHFPRQTAIDCNMATRITKTDVKEWLANDLVEVVGYNEDVNSELLNKIKDGVKNSPMVEPKLKEIID